MPKTIASLTGRRATLILARVALALSAGDAPSSRGVRAISLDPVLTDAITPGVDNRRSRWKRRSAVRPSSASSATMNIIICRAKRASSPSPTRDLCRSRCCASASIPQAMSSASTAPGSNR